MDGKGKLPVSINDAFKVNDGLITEKVNVLGFSTPENVGMSSQKLAQIETVVNKAIDGKMTPGMQILVARKGKVIYQKAVNFFLHHSYCSFSVSIQPYYYFLSGAGRLLRIIQPKIL